MNRKVGHIHNYNFLSRAEAPAPILQSVLDKLVDQNLVDFLIETQAIGNLVQLPHNYGKVRVHKLAQQGLYDIRQQKRDGLVLALLHRQDNRIEKELVIVDQSLIHQPLHFDTMNC